MTTTTERKPTSSPEPMVLRTGRARIKGGSGPLSSWVWKPRSLVLTDRALVTPGNTIPLKHISKVERVDNKPFCLLLEARHSATSTSLSKRGQKQQRLFISFKDDGELYDWQDDVYARCPLGGGNPQGFMHHVHVGFDPDTGAFTGLPSQWSTSLGAQDDATALYNVERRRASTPGPQTKSASASRTSTPLQTTPTLRYTFATSGSGAGLFSKWNWGAMCTRGRGFGTGKGGVEVKEVGAPFGFVHDVHIGIDAVTGEFTGLPDHWKALLQKSPSPAPAPQKAG